MHTLSVTIGRNVGDVIMPTQDWLSFQENIVDSVEGYTNLNAELHTGTGYYDGKVEESAIISVRQELQFTKVQIDAIKSELMDIVNAYSQDCVALTLGQSELVGAE